MHSKLMYIRSIKRDKTLSFHFSSKLDVSVLSISFKFGRLSSILRAKLNRNECKIENIRSYSQIYSSSWIKNIYSFLINTKELYLLKLYKLYSYSYSFIYSNIEHIEHNTLNVRTKLLRAQIINSVININSKIYIFGYFNHFFVFLNLLFNFV